jgi:plastocyanin
VTAARPVRRLGWGAGPALLLGVLAVAAIGCASANSAANASPVPTTSVDLPKSYKFVPAAITVKAGSTVTWTNDDNFTHSVQLDGAQPLVMKPGTQVSQTFDTAGTFHYICSFHPQNMQGTVVVTAG